MIQSTTIRRRQPYITRSNRYVVKSTPSGKKATYKKKKIGKAPSCGDCKKKIQGVASKRPAAFARLKKSQRTVARMHGGSLCANCVKERVVVAFLSQEEKMVMNENE